ncbi:hypothetical protein CARUB_v10024495mg [Capsella rubella]|uniref:Neprosin PEP catalytic domain-containing protein n=1 Tax=Capsella rubella TaxID=81985 RepID=R0HF72_9BRAS|nr:hypothetical protein CARUB_v10024495mg [Capsella rubella]
MTNSFSDFQKEGISNCPRRGISPRRSQGLGKKKASDGDIVASDGVKVVCVGIYDQPAFYHPLLQKHKLQESPSKIPVANGTRRNSEWHSFEAQFSTAKCPRGTIPMQNLTALDHRLKPYTGEVNTSFTPHHEYAEVSTDSVENLYGTRATISVWQPVVENHTSEMSVSQIWLTLGAYKSKDLNTVEVGWQSDAYVLTGGYNLRGPGFIQISSEIVLGGAISPVSSIGGSQFEITILVWKDPESGNWWLMLGPHLVGYWPSEIFTTLRDHATKVSLGGEIVNMQSFGRHTKTQMGSGRFPQEGFGNASYFRNIAVVDNTCSFQMIPELTIEADGTHYDLKNLHRDELETHFFYGGPGFGHRVNGGAGYCK